MKMADRKSGNPIYKIVFLGISLLFMGATFLPLLYSVIFPQKDVQTIIVALREQGDPPQEAVSIVNAVTASAGRLTEAMKIGYYWETRVGFQPNSGLERVHVSQTTYIAWFQKRDGMLIAVTRYEDDRGRKTYNISPASWITVVRGYVLPIGLFVGAIFFMARNSKA